MRPAAMQALFFCSAIPVLLHKNVDKPDDAANGPPGRSFDNPVSSVRRGGGHFRPGRRIRSAKPHCSTEADGESGSRSELSKQLQSHLGSQDPIKGVDYIRAQSSKNA